MSRAASDPLASSLAGTMSVSIEKGLLLYRPSQATCRPSSTGAFTQTQWP